jgi:nitroreductase
MPHLPSIDKTAVTAAPVLSAIAERWSPRSYDATYTISAAEVTSLLEAARWAPSANNLQPWRFSVIKREDALFADLVQHGLKGWNQAWAPNASAIIIVSAVVADNDGKQNAFAAFDAGLATQNILLEAIHLGLAAHVLGGIEPAWLDEALGLDDNIKPLVGITVGKRALPEALEGALHDREVAPRTRLSLDEIVLHGKP